MTDINPDKVRDKLLAQPEKQDVVLGAIHKYNARLAVMRDRLKRYAGNELQTIQKGISELEMRVADTSRIVDHAPSNLAARKKLDEQRSNKAVLECIVAQTDRGVPVVDALAALPEPSRVSSYKKAMDYLRQRGIVIDVTDRADVAKTVRDAADFQVPLLHRQFELPAPFSQKLLKDPMMGKEEAFRVYINYLVDEEIKKVYDVDLDTIYHDRNDSRHAKARRHARDLFRSPEFRHRAYDVASDLMQFQPVYLLESKKTKEEFEEAKRTPEATFRHAFSQLRPDVNYLTMIFRGFDVFHQKTFLTTNNSVGMRMHLYSSFLEDLLAHGQDVRVSDVTSISKLYAHGAEGETMSRSGARTKYDPLVNYISDFRRPLPPKAYSLWADISGLCHCKDLKYIGRLHQRKEYDFVYFCMHVVALACTYMDRAVHQGDTVLSPFLFPLDEQLDFEQRTSRSLFVRKDGGDIKVANRGEREWLNMANASERGYARTYTTDFAVARDCMKKMLLS
jgi:hypothetical protein